MVPIPVLSGTFPPRQNRLLAVWSGEYHADYYVLSRWDSCDYVTVYPNPFLIDKYPASACPFYTLPDLGNCPTPAISSSVVKRFFLVVNISMASSSRRG